MRALSYLALAALVAAPWWLTVVARDGLAPFLSGGQATVDIGVTFQYLVTFSFTDEPFLTVLGAIGLVGFLYQIATRRYVLPAWIVLVFVLAPRGAATSAMIPLSMLVAVAVDEVLLARLPERPDDAANGATRSSVVLADRFGRAVIVRRTRPGHHRGRQGAGRARFAAPCAAGSQPGGHGMDRVGRAAHCSVRRRDRQPVVPRRELGVVLGRGR